MVVGQRHAPASLPPGKDPVLLVQEAGWPQGPSGRVSENLAPTPGFDPRTVHLVASQYTDWAIPAHRYIIINMQILCEIFCLRRHNTNSWWTHKTGHTSSSLPTRAPFGNITAVIKLAASCWRRSLESCPVLCAVSTNTLRVQPPPTLGLRLIR